MAEDNNKDLTTTKPNEHGIGRPTKLTEDTVKKLESVFKLDAPVKTACAYAGISRETYYTWLKENDGFSDRMAKAQEYARIAAGNVVMNAIVQDRDVSTARWWLEKRYPDEFGSNAPTIAQQFNVNGDEMKVEFIEKK